MRRPVQALRGALFVYHKALGGLSGVKPIEYWYKEKEVITEHESKR